MTEIYFPIKNKNKTLELERKIEEQQKEINELKNRIVLDTAMLDDSISKATVKKNYIPKAKIEKKAGYFKLESEKAIRNNDKDRADFYYDLYRNFTKLLESEVE